MENPIIFITSSDEEEVERGGRSGFKENRREGGGVIVRSKVDEYEEIADLGGFEHLKAMIEAEAFMRRKKRNRYKKKKKRKVGPWYKEIADLTSFENLKAMLEAEAFMRRKKRNRKKKKSKNEFCAQEDVTDDVAKEKGQLGNVEALDVVEVSKPSIEGEEREGNGSKKKRRRRHDGSKRYKFDEYEMISDLSDFENRKAMIEAEAFMGRKKRYRKKRKEKSEVCARENVSINAEEEKGQLAKAEASKIVEEVSKPEPVPISAVDKPQNLVDIAAKEKDSACTVKAVQTTRGADDGVNAIEVIDLCLSSSKEGESISDVRLGRSVDNMGTAVKTTEATGVDDRVSCIEVIDLCLSLSEGDRLILDTRLGRSVEDMVPVGLVEREMRRKRRRKKSKAMRAKDKFDEAKDEDDAKFNFVLRMLLRKPRYFDPPDCHLGTCSNCGKEGHTAVSCRARKLNKPCFLCGSLEHIWKYCRKGQDCFISRGRDRNASVYPETDQGNDSSSNLCLRCGDSGHDMFLCRNDYRTNDLKEIQCYVCKSFGHLCCVSSNTGPKQVSCYNCGQSSHLGPDCTKSCEAQGGEELSIRCYKCGEEGHFARRCGIRVKDRLRISDLLSTAERLPSKARICIGSSSTFSGPTKTHGRENDCVQGNKGSGL